MTSYKLSLPAAIVINLNIILSTGIFLNSIPLSQYTGGISWLPYLITGILLIPLIIAMATLLNHHREGSFYGIGKQELNSFWGFASTWSYFIAKPASAALMIHFFSFLLRELFPVLQIFSIFNIDLIIITLFVLLNLLNMKIGRLIQITFVGIKAIPIAFIITAGLIFFKFYNFSPINIKWDGIPLALPLALFACSGFEATLSLSQHIKDAQKNASRAIIYSYIIAITIYVFYQFSYYGGINLNILSSIPPFEGIAYFLNSIHAFKPHLKVLLYICMGISALGGAYGILFSNKWNLYTLALHRHTFFHKALQHKNDAGIAYWCLFIETALCLTHLFITNANQIMMQQMSAFGSAISYTICIVAFLILAFKTIKKRWAIIIGICALLNCIIFLTSCINGFIQHGILAFLLFSFFMSIGLIMFAFTNQAHISKR